MKQMADKKRDDTQLGIGDMVYLRLQPYRQTYLQLRRNTKLALRFYGPFEILGKVEPVVYRLKLLEGSQIHNAFQVSQLKPQLKRADVHLCTLRICPYQLRIILNLFLIKF